MLFLCSTSELIHIMTTLPSFRGSSPQDIVLPLPDWQPAVHPGSLEEVGPLVEHVYEVSPSLSDSPTSPLCQGVKLCRTDDMDGAVV